LRSILISESFAYGEQLAPVGLSIRYWCGANARAAWSGGFGMALMEQTVLDRHDDRPVNASVTDYLVPVNLDIDELESCSSRKRSLYGGARQLCDERAALARIPRDQSKGCVPALVSEAVPDRDARHLASWPRASRRRVQVQTFDS
jgi:hypothetical protein